MAIKIPVSTNGRNWHEVLEVTLNKTVQVKKYILSLCCVLNITVNAQDWKWAKNITHEDYTPFIITECRNTGFYLTGVFQDSISFDSFTLYDTAALSFFIGKFDTNGQCLWLKKTFRVREACADSLGNIYVSGFFWGQQTVESNTLTTSFSRAGILAKYSTSGSLLNLEKVDGNNVWCKIKVNSKQQLIVSTGYYNDSLNYKGNIFKDSTAVIFRLDANFNLLQSLQTKAFSTVNQLELDKNDTIYMVCDKDMPCMYCGITKIVKYSPNFMLLIDHYYSTGVGSHYYEEPHITCHSDGNIYAMQPHTYSNNSVLKFSSKLNLIWSKGLYWAGSLISRNDKLFAIGRTRTMQCSDSIIKSSIVLEIDTSFSCLWYKALPFDNFLTGPGPFFANAFVDVYNNLYTTGFLNKKSIFGSDTIGSTTLSAFTAKLDYSKIAIGLPTYNVKEGILIFPNPSQGVYTVKLNEKKSETKICIYDVLGNCILRKDCPNTETKIDLTCQPKGIYFIEIISEGRKTVNKVVVQ